ncbi:hypothetical protein [Flagellimonas marinaquae]|uniref:hypothetical protein n=1 Tax=Flagellimonas marinaquae TaxID=254955 RepID=UPI000F8EB534|nr:hypothetical protein [Allomuricauda aquimarina]
MKAFSTIVLFFLFFFHFSHSQEFLKEITKTFDNGQPMFVNYLDVEDLKKVKTEIYDETGNRIFSLSFNKESGLPDGEFFDLINKGHYEDGVLFCENCLLVGANTPAVFSFNYNKQNTFVTKGSVINGRFFGEVERFGYFDSQSGYWSSKQYSTPVPATAGIEFRDVKTYATDAFERIPSTFINYNKNGQIEGSYTKNLGELKIELDVINGIIQTYVVKDNKGIVVDSLSNQNKIWKINYKFKKNDGLIVFNGFDNIRGPREYGQDYLESSRDIYNNDYMIAYNIEDEKVLSDSKTYINRTEALTSARLKTIKQTTINPIIPMGGNISVDYEKGSSPGSIFQREVNTGGRPCILDNNGIYSINNENQTKSYLSNLYIELNDRDGGNKGYLKGSDRENNLFALIYNYLINDSKKYLNKSFDDSTSEGVDGSLLIFLSNLDLKSELNTFKKYLKIPINISQAEAYESALEYKKYVRLPVFFSKVISLPDYLRAISEIISSEKTEVQQLYVWNYSLKKYDLVDFESLIDIAENKEIKNVDIEGKELFDDSDYRVVYTSDKDGEGDYIEVLENNILQFRNQNMFLWKIEQLIFKNDYQHVNLYYKIYFSDIESFMSYKPNGNFKIIGKDEVGLFVIVSTPNSNK